MFCKKSNINFLVLILTLYNITGMSLYLIFIIFMSDMVSFAFIYVVIRVKIRINSLVSVQIFLIYLLYKDEQKIYCCRFDNNKVFVIRVKIRLILSYSFKFSLFICYTMLNRKSIVVGLITTKYLVSLIT